MENQLRVRVAWVCDKGPSRNFNEDALIIGQSGTIASTDRDEGMFDSDPADGPLVLAVADGCGGSHGGEFIARTALDYIADSVFTAEYAASPSRLRALVKSVNSQLNERMTGSTMGATLTAASLYGESAVIAQVGDSRCYRWRAGELNRVTVDQTLVELLVRDGQLSPEKALNHTHRNVILQAIAVTPDILVNTSVVGLRHGDRLLLCTDGVWKHVDDGAITSFLTEAGAPIDAVKSIEALTLKAGGYDNFAIIVAFIELISGNRSDSGEDIVLDVETSHSAAELAHAAERAQRDRSVSP